MGAKLGGGGHHQRLLRAAAAKCPRAEVGDERPHAKEHGGLGVDEVGDGETGQRFGKGLDEAASQCRRGGGTGLGGHGHVIGDAQFGTAHHYFQAVAGKGEGGDDGAAAKAAKRPFYKFPLAPHKQIKHRNNSIYVRCRAKPHMKRFVGGRQLGIGHVDVVGQQVVAEFRGDKRLPKGVDMLKLVYQPPCVIEVKQGRRPIAAGFVVENGDTLAAGAKEHGVAI